MAGLDYRIKKDYDSEILDICEGRLEEQKKASVILNWEEDETGEHGYKIKLFDGRTVWLDVEFKLSFTESP